MSWIAGTLELITNVRYGLTSRGSPLFRFIPYDKRWGPFAVGCSLRELGTNVHAIIEPQNTQNTQNIQNIQNTQGETGKSMQKGSIVQVLGEPSERTEQSMLLMTYAHDSKKGLRKILPCITDTFAEEDREVVDGYTFHIDPEGCRDVDDAFTFEQMEDGWRVFIHIADVDSWVRFGSPVDVLAKQRASTFYSLEGKVLSPMFPSSISEECASLLPGSRKPAVSLSFTWRPGHPIENVRWVQTLITCTRSFTYEEAMEGVDTIPSLSALRDLSSELSVETVEAPDSHTWVQSLMILYNTHAGLLLREAGQGILRRHSDKKQEHLTVIGESGLSIVSMEAAEYVHACEENVAHFGLQKTAYAYASSPIRRYCDLMNQRIIKSTVNKRPLSYIPTHEDIVELNRRQKQGKAFQRDLFFMKVLSGQKKEVEGIAISENRVWIPSWKRKITIKAMTLVKGQEYMITWYENKNLPRWKDKIVFRATAAGAK